MSLSQYILDAREQYRLEVRERNTWLTRLRWYYLTVLATISGVTATLANDNAARIQQIAITAACVGLIINTLLWALTKPKRQQLLYYQAIAVLQLLLDIALAATVIYFQNGLGSRAVILFAIPIVGAGLLFGRGFAYIATSLSAAGYTLALVLYRHNNPAIYELNRITLPAVFYAVVFLVIAIIVSAYSNRNASNEREKSYTELLSLLRHQLYHPSGVIAGITDMLEHSDNYAKWPASDKAYLQQLKHENKRQYTMIENLLQSVSSSNNELQDTKLFDLVALLNRASISCATGTKRIKDLQSDLPHKAIKVEGNPEQLETAFTNVLDNAFRYTEKGIPVIVAISEEDKRVAISIHDKGKGISEGVQHEIFTLFSKMQSRISGDPKKLYDSGLGLYVSKLIIERHGGTLELSSSAQYGTNITVTLAKKRPKALMA